MRLDLARYREVAAFAQFGSDLDAGTQQQLRRGDRLIELLKQLQHQPLPVEKEIVSIFCGSNGYLDDLELSDIARFELEFLAYMDQDHSDILNEIVATGNLSDELTEQLNQAVSTFKASFQPSDQQ